MNFVSSKTGNRMVQSELIQVDSINFYEGLKVQIFANADYPPLCTTQIVPPIGHVLLRTTGIG